MKWQFGQEFMPALKVEVRRDERLALVCIGVSSLPDNHPLALALEQLTEVGIKVPLFAWTEPWSVDEKPGVVERILVITEQTWSCDTPATQLVRWYLEHQDVLNRPFKPALPWVWSDPLVQGALDLQREIRLCLGAYGRFLPVVHPVTLLKGIIET